MDPSTNKIHLALQAVSQLRQQWANDPALAQASLEVKRFQARRFQASYADLLHSPRYKTATAFFLHELYSDQDYAERDQQFARIANTIAKLFPQAVVSTAAALAEVHALTEQLDDLLARQWLADKSASTRSSECARYIRCWRRVGDLAARRRQLEVVLQLGHELDRLTRTRGLRTLLKLMRRPAAAAGLDTLQHFLEAGFDAFAEMRGADEFLSLIKQRESEWIRALFDDEAVACETRIKHLLAANAPH
ncbi:hypothetical protein SAMN05216344_105197 [Polaromonas sp. OV174]|uniref:FFLEELY motif protein n=1 Tax=Polaromonas sp. OV174 TaxID=1855300 RepID=UPI0008EDD4D3|nr:hypothetical protein [Polaromonas sp. OV174]SFB92496.1 hypothetical protein SAMN05216344_105197 [Polaromonas sp. OV174]